MFAITCYKCPCMMVLSFLKLFSFLLVLWGSVITLKYSVFLNYAMSTHFPITPVKQYDKKADQKLLPQLRKLYGYKKTIPKSIELQALRALAHYPELLKVNIEFVFTDMKIAHQSRPVPLSLTWIVHERKYRVYISTQLKKELAPTLFTNLNYNAQIGVLCHELAHTSEYIRTSLWSFMWMGLKYVLPTFESYKHRFENLTDMRAIQHGAGYQLLEWSKAVHDVHVKDGRGDNYLSPSMIRKILSEHLLYR